MTHTIEDPHRYEVPPEEEEHDEDRNYWCVRVRHCGESIR